MSATSSWVKGIVMASLDVVSYSRVRSATRPPHPRLRRQVQRLRELRRKAPYFRDKSVHQDGIYAWVLAAQLVEGLTMEAEGLGRVQAVDRGVARRRRDHGELTEEVAWPEHANQSLITSWSSRPHGDVSLSDEVKGVAGSPSWNTTSPRANFRLRQTDRTSRRSASSSVFNSTHSTTRILSRHRSTRTGAPPVGRQPRSRQTTG